MNNNPLSAGVNDEIRRLHALAIEHSNCAVDYAKQAGALLLEVKRTLPHGEFLPWLENAVSISARQAQRYMRAALGKPVKPRILAGLKYDTASHFPTIQPGEMLRAQCLSGQSADELWLWPVLGQTQFVHVARCRGGIVDFLKRGIALTHLWAIPFFAGFPWRDATILERGPCAGIELNPYDLEAQHSHK